MVFSICLPKWIFFGVAFFYILSCGFIKSIFCFVWTGVCVCAALSCMLDVCHIHLCRSRCSLVILLCHVWRMEMSLALASRLVLSSLLYSFTSAQAPASKVCTNSCCTKFSLWNYSHHRSVACVVICYDYRNLTWSRLLSWEECFYSLIQYLKRDPTL